VTETGYLDLAAACDALLWAPPVTPEKVAVSWLHVLSEHPNNLPQYQSVFDRPELLAEAKDKLWQLAGIAEPLAQSLRSPANDPAPESVQFPMRVDVLFISHLVSAQARPESADFYYGNLPEELASRGLSSLVALRDNVRNADRSVKERLTRGGVTSRFVLPRWSTFSQECRFVRSARLAALALLQETTAAQTSFKRAVALEAARHAATRSTIASLRLHRQVKRLCTRFRPRALFVTWEGQAWERLAFHAARSVDPTIRCIGYQHTVLFPRSHALKRPLGGAYDPDVILTSGDVTRDVLRVSDGLRGIPIMTYGSPRRPAAAGQRAPDASTRCLVIPEGLESECLTLFDFALTAAARMPDTQFVLRTHPVLPFDSLARRHPRFRTLPGNMRASDRVAIDDDCALCDWALYRGSSAAVQTVLAGVRPVYVERPGELPFDPLFALQGWRRHVATVESFGAVVAVDRAAAAGQRHREWEPARAFCDRYFAPPDPDIIQGLLTE
jgi:hypothetical protein